MLTLLNQHRTIRKYTDRPINDDLMSRLLEASCRASNTGNMQAYSIVVTTDDEIKKKLAPTHFNQSMVVNAPAVLTFCADFNRFSKWCEMRDAIPGYDNFQSFTAAAIDAVIAAQTFCIAAEAEGLGICYLGTTTYNAQEIIDVLDLPRLVVPVITVTVGYPDGSTDQTDRLPLSAVVFKEKYLSITELDIEQWYAEKENSEFYKQFVSENNKETLAQVFTDIRYSKKNNEFFSDIFIAALKQQGFLNAD